MPPLVSRTDAREAVRAAFQRWSDVVCGDGRRTSLRFTEREDLAAPSPTDPRAPDAEHFGIYFRREPWADVGSDTRLALTTLTFDRSDAYVQWGDIELNLASNRFSTRDDGAGIDLQAVFTHEVGHYLGLDHNRDPASIMESSYCQTADRCAEGSISARSLGPDDQKFVCALFPPEGPAGVHAEEQGAGCAVVAHATADRWRLSPFVIVALLWTAIRARRG